MTKFTQLTADSAPSLDDIIATVDFGPPVQNKKVTISDLVDLIAGQVEITGKMTAYGGFAAPAGYLLCYGQAVSRTNYADLFDAIVPELGTFTITIASPGVATMSGHGMLTGQAIFITSTGSLPTGLSQNTLYYIIRVDANTFRLATSRANAIAGTAINTSGSQSGTHTLRFCPYGLGDGSTTFNIPDARGRVLAGADDMGGTAATRLTNPSTTSGGVYGSIGATGGEEAHVQSATELRGHQHGAGNVYNKTTGQAGSDGNILSLTSAWGNQNISMASAGSSVAANVVQPTLNTNVIIKT